VQPDVAVVTNLANAHRQVYASLEHIAREKASIFRHVNRNGRAVICRDAPCFDIFAAAAQQQGVTITTYGHHPDADWRLLSYDHGSGAARLLVDGADWAVKLPIGGDHIALNAIAAMIAVSATHADWRSAIPRLSAWELLAGRGKARDVSLANGATITVIDEAFNAAPNAVRAVLNNFQLRPARGRKVAILGEMRELGSVTLESHVDIIGLLNSLSIDKVYFIGKNFMDALDHIHYHHPHESFPAIDDLEVKLKDMLIDSDQVLIKGSHASGVYRLVSKLNKG
jgi:UDP-N-acetylmuramoyl-tripeptide--D-alanyl-D-alanine ligase